MDEFAVYLWLFRVIRRQMLQPAVLSIINNSWHQNYGKIKESRETNRLKIKYFLVNIDKNRCWHRENQRGRQFAAPLYVALWPGRRTVFTVLAAAAAADGWLPRDCLFANFSVRDLTKETEGVSFRKAEKWNEWRKRYLIGNRKETMTVQFQPVKGRRPWKKKVLFLWSDICLYKLTVKKLKTGTRG